MSFDFDFELAKRAAQELPPSQTQPKTRKMSLLQKLMASLPISPRPSRSILRTCPPEGSQDPSAY
jgi:hypothetical protein